MPHIFDLRKIAQVEFGDIVQSVFDLDYKLRIILVDNSFIDVHLSESLPGKFGFLFDRSGLDVGGG